MTSGRIFTYVGIDSHLACVATSIVLKIKVIRRIDLCDCVEMSSGPAQPGTLAKGDKAEALDIVWFAAAVGPVYLFRKYVPNKYA